MNQEAKNWLKIAKYDLRSAEVSYENQLYLKVYENSHSALEKLLKGVISSRNEKPSKIHDLLRLASQAVIENLQSELREVLDELNTVYFSVRYPEDFDMIQDSITQEKAGNIIKEAKRIFSWLEKKIK